MRILSSLTKIYSRYKQLDEKENGESFIDRNNKDPLGI